MGVGGSFLFQGCFGSWRSFSSRCWCGANQFLACSCAMICFTLTGHSALGYVWVFAGFHIFILFVSLISCSWSAPLPCCCQTCWEALLLFKANESRTCQTAEAGFVWIALGLGWSLTLIRSSNISWKSMTFATTAVKSAFGSMLFQPSILYCCEHKKKFTIYQVDKIINLIQS